MTFLTSEPVHKWVQLFKNLCSSSALTKKFLDIINKMEK